VVEGKHTVYRMSAGTLEEKDDWIACIRSVADTTYSINFHSFILIVRFIYTDKVSATIPSTIC